MRSDPQHSSRGDFGRRPARIVSPQWQANSSASAKRPSINCCRAVGLCATHSSLAKTRQRQPLRTAPPDLDDREHTVDCGLAHWDHTVLLVSGRDEHSSNPFLPRHCGLPKASISPMAPSTTGVWTGCTRHQRQGISFAVTGCMATSHLLNGSLGDPARNCSATMKCRPGWKASQA